MGRPKKESAPSAENRIKSGKIKPTEPTSLETLQAAVNAPSDLSVFVGDTEYPLVELGFLQWKTYVTVLSGSFQSVLTEVTPLYEGILQSWGMLKNFSSTKIDDFRQDCPTLLAEEVQGVLSTWGVKVSMEQAIALKEKADNPAGFNSLVGSLVYTPLLGSFKSISIGTVLEKSVNNLPDLVMASLTSSLTRRKVQYNYEDLKNKVLTELDGFDMINIVVSQISLYQQRGKIRSFFDQIKLKILPSLSGGMPTA